MVINCELLYYTVIDFTIFEFLPLKPSITTWIVASILINSEIIFKSLLHVSQSLYNWICEDFKTLVQMCWVAISQITKNLLRL